MRRYGIVIAVVAGFALPRSSAVAQDWRLVDDVVPAAGLAAFDSVRHRVIAIGTANETREWDGVVWLHRPVPPLPGIVLALTFDDWRGVAVALVGDQVMSGPAQTWEFDGATWTRRSTTQAPWQLRDPAIAFDSVRGRTVVFGGGQWSFSNDTWEWDGISWQLAAPVTRPPQRTAAAMAFDATRGRTVLFGGEYPNWPYSFTVYDDTWEWDGANWTQCTPATTPSAHSRHRLAFDSSRHVIVMFGKDPLSAPDTWEYDGTDWKQRAGAMPSTREFAGLVYDASRARTLMFGGRSPWWLSGPIPDDRTDVWAWDGIAWVLRLDTPAPVSRPGASMAYSASRDRLVLFGGFNVNPATLSETWEWDGASWQLRSLPVSPPGRHLHSMWSDGSDVFVFGGRLPSGPYLNDTWRFDGTTWSPDPSTVAPPAQMRASIAFDPTTGGALMLGNLGDTWRWSATAGWTQLTPVSAPSPRSGAAIAGDPLRQRVVLWGGFGGAPLDDTWEWDGTHWMQQSPVHVPPASSLGCSMAFEPTLGTVVLQTYGPSSPTMGALPETWVWTGSDWLHLSTPNPSGGGIVTAAPGRLRAFNGSHLFELVPQPPLASAYGASCPSPEPRLLVDAWPRLGAANFSLTSTGNATNSPVLFIVGTAPANTPIASCTLLVQPGGPLAFLTADATGICTLHVPLPTLPALIGLRTFCQTFALCASGLCSTNGVEVTIGG